MDRPLDWSKCVICQTSSVERLTCPARSKRKDNKGRGYATLAYDLEEFEKLDQLPESINLRLLKGVSTLEVNLSENEGSWHKSCRDQFNKTKLERIMKRKAADEPLSISGVVEPKLTRSSMIPVDVSQDNEGICFFCDERAAVKDLSEASTFGMDARVRSAALFVGNQKLLAKLSSGDMIAIEAKYHKKCLAYLYNEVRKKKHEEGKVEDQDGMIHSMVFAELIIYLEESRKEQGVSVFKLSDLVDQYSSRSFQLGINMDTHIHASRLKTKLLAYLPALQAHNKGRDVFLSFDNAIADILSNAFFQDCDSDAMCLVRAANIVRRDIFAHEYEFKGSFPPDCQLQSTPASLLALVRMILNGPNIESQAASKEKQPSLSLAQLLKFNCVKFRKGAENIRHNRCMETSLPIYIGTMLHTKTRRKDLVNRYHELGLSISYERVLQISTDVGNCVSQQFEDNNVVCPPYLQHGIFATFAVDNIDHNPSSVTACDSFHGTAISLVQHPEDKNTNNIRQKEIKMGYSKTIKPLPQLYVQVMPITKTCVGSPHQKLEKTMTFDDSVVLHANQTEHLWLEHISTALPDEHQDCDENAAITQQKSLQPWAAYHAEKTELIRPCCSMHLLPMFPDCAHSVPMIKHSMAIIQKTTEFINPGQTPVSACDQPLFALAKQIQWTWPGEFGEEKFVVMLGGLHIEMALLAAAGKLLKGSGWTESLVLAGVTTAGKADSLLAGSKVTCTSSHVGLSLSPSSFCISKVPKK